MQSHSDVIIIGGGLNGLTAAVLLAARHVRCTVIECHERTSIQYKFAGISPRSMEIFRSVGLEEEIRRNRTGDQKAGAILRMRNLADPQRRSDGAAWADTSQISPTTAETCDQERLEPLLKARAEQLGAEMRFGTEALSISQHPESVDVLVRNLRSGGEATLSASFVIAADGVSGRTREWLGIERHGPGELQHWANVIFETDLEPRCEGRQVTSFFLSDIGGTFVPRQNGRWLMAVPLATQGDEPGDDLNAEQALALIRKGAARDDVKANIVDIRRWDVAALIADRYREGRVFLLGDAAHVMPPTGAFGGNTGIHDAHNLAWKLESVIRGKADDALLDTYDRERRPVAEASLEQSLARLQAWFKHPTKPLPPPKPVVDDYAVVFGHLYHDGAIVSEHPPRELQFEKPDELSGRPGSRAPHVVFVRGGESISSLDLFGRGFVLLTGAQAHEWFEAAQDSALRDLPIDVYRIADDGDLQNPDGSWLRRFGITAKGCTLIRPDGFVAWRSPAAEEHASNVLAVVFARLHFRLDGFPVDARHTPRRATKPMPDARR